MHPFQFAVADFGGTGTFTWIRDRIAFEDDWKGGEVMRDLMSDGGTYIA
jgi:hypothetical protein